MTWLFDFDIDILHALLLLHCLISLQ